MSVLITFMFEAARARVEDVDEAGRRADVSAREEQESRRC